MSAPEPALRAGRHDAMARRRGLRTQGQRGIMVYIPAECLVAAGYSLDEPPPYYRTWPGRGGSVMLRLYRER